jgi:acyl-CoA synthetase (AMP-forming)/AMP-acid ligase II
MHLTTLVDMAESGLGDRVLVGGADDGLTGSELAVRVRLAGSAIAGTCESVVLAAENHPLMPVVMLGAAWAGVAFVPVNYRLEDHQLVELIGRQPGSTVLADAPTQARLRAQGIDAVLLPEWLEALPADGATVAPAEDDEAVAIVLYTSGTTSAPKAAILRHRHLMAYLFGTVEYAGAGEDEAVLVSVPPYHIAGMANMLSNLFAGRRLVYLEHFDAETWLATARAEQITHAMVVPTMLSRIVDAIDAGHEAPTTLRSVSYGGSKISQRVLERALERFPDTGFVNAYGLTETASTIAVLGPEDHRAAMASDDEHVRRRLSSAGRIVPMVEAEIRGEDDSALGPGEVGILHVRGDQIAGEYATGSVLDSDGWFCTRDRASIDADGYLFIEGRADDTIIRGGENIAPSEIEEVLLTHDAVKEACVVGLADDEWGQRLVAAIVLAPAREASPDELRAFVRERLRGAKTPESIVFCDSLPHTPTGKMLRRSVQEELQNIANSQ